MNYKYLQSWIVLILIVGSIITFSAIPYTPKHSIYNEGDLGASFLKESLDKFDFNISRLLISPIILNTEKNIDVMVIIGSERKYTTAEIDAYEKFVNRGGMLFIFEDFGPAKNIAKKMGITFLPGVLRETHKDLQINRPTQMFIQDLIISQFMDGAILPPLLVSEAVSLIDIGGFFEGKTLPLLMTFPTAFLDTNNNNIMESTDIRSPIGLPVGLLKFYGNGTLIVIGDASLPLNRYWQKTVTLLGQEYILTNALWTLLIMTTLINSFGKSSIVFDESHQEISLVSAVGILNLLAGTWVGLWNTIEITVMLTLITTVFTSTRIKNRWKDRRRFNRTRVNKLKTVDENSLISVPSSAEKSISEQYILYKVMEDNFIQVANSNLIKKLRNSGKAVSFLDEIRKKYDVPDLSYPMKFDKLLDLHKELRDFVDENSSKWL